MWNVWSPNYIVNYVALCLINVTALATENIFIVCDITLHLILRLSNCYFMPIVLYVLVSWIGLSAMEKKLYRYVWILISLWRSIRRLRRWWWQLIGSTEKIAHEINVYVAEHPTDTCTLNVSLGETQRGTVCGKVDPLK